MTKKISELDEGSALDGSELVPVVQNGATVRVEASEFGSGDALKPVNEGPYPENIVATTEETYEEENWTWGTAIYVFEVNFAVDTWRDLILPTGGDEYLGLWTVDPRTAASAGDGYFTDIAEAASFERPVPYLFKGGVDYWVGVYVWDSVGTPVDIGPTEYGLQNPSRAGEIRRTLFPTAAVKGILAHAEGDRTLSSGEASHAEGRQSEALHDYAHAEGFGSIARERESHAEGRSTQTLKRSSHAEGWGSIARTQAAHAAANSWFDEPGDAQYQRIIRRNVGANVSFDFDLPAGYLCGVRGMLILRNSNDEALWRFEGLVEEGSPYTVLWSSIETLHKSSGFDTWEPQLIDASSGGVRLNVQNYTGTNRMMALIETVELGPL